MGKFSTIGHEVNFRDDSADNLTQGGQLSKAIMPDLKLPAMARSRIVQKSDLDNGSKGKLPQFRQTDGNSIDTSIQNTSRSVLMDYNQDALIKF